MNLANIELFIMDKIREYTQSIDLTDDAIPPCSPAERWDKPTKYAVKKDGRKTALRVLDDEQSAHKLADELGMGHFVEVRHGESVKCRGYCLCREFCNYYQDTLPVANIA